MSRIQWLLDDAADEIDYLEKKVIAFEYALYQIKKQWFEPGPDKGVCGWCAMKCGGMPPAHDPTCVLQIAYDVLEKYK